MRYQNKSGKNRLFIVFNFLCSVEVERVRKLEARHQDTTEGELINKAQDEELQEEESETSGPSTAPQENRKRMRMQEELDEEETKDDERRR